MLLHAKYFGTCSMGDTSIMGGIHIMKENWKEIPDQAVFGVERVEKQIVNAFGGKVYTVAKGRDRAFFCAKEYENGKFQIFQFSAKDNERLLKLLNE